MRVSFILAAAASIVSASVFSSEPDVLVSASFPESNQFGKIVNGDKNVMTVTIENRSDRNVTLRSIGGSFHHAKTNKVIRNTTTLTYGVDMIEKTKLQIPYTFHSEIKPGDARLQVWLDHTFDGKKYRVSGYDSIVTVVEPPASVFDFELISTYLIILGFFSGLAYWAYQAYAPQPKPTRKSKATAPDVSSPVGPVIATGAGGYQEEWIPAHHVRKPKSVRGQSSASVNAAAINSGDDTSAAESSGPEGPGNFKRRKSRK